MLLEILRHSPSAEEAVMRPEDVFKGPGSFNIKVIGTIRANRDAALAKARQEIEFCQRHSIQILTIIDEHYPARLRDCPDAPAVLFYRGKADLNATHILAVVGTRKITEYGKQICARLTERLAELLPDTLVVSGLAYGVDIHAHRGCLEHGLSTIGVVAHGLDQIYPATHRNDATRMVERGGILTEYTRGTRPLQGNFLRRNRIVAGMADATIIIESAEHGGSLVTARIAGSYGRSVFAFPGRINDPYSVGCNNLILGNKAMMAICADDIIQELGWWPDTTAYRQQPQQLELFSNEALNDSRLGAADSTRNGAKSSGNALLPAMAPEYRQLAEVLLGTDGLDAKTLAAKTGLSAAVVGTCLFEMEMDGIVRILPGGFYMLTK